MSEKFSKLFSLEKNLYAEGVPVIIKEGTLMKDNDNDKLVIQLQMLNICKQPIKAVKLKIIGYDTFEQRVYTKEFQYIDMITQPNSDFGSETMLAIDDQTVRSFTVELVQVLFDDKTSWYGKGEKFVHIPNDVTIDEYLYNKKNDKYERALNLYSLIGLEYTLKAKSIFEELGDFKDSVERVKDCDAKINKIEEEKREKEKRSAELAEQTRIADEKKKAKTKKISIAVGAVVALGILVINVIIPTVRYNKAIELYENGDYIGALQTIKYIGKCNDSKGIIKDCLFKINTQSPINSISIGEYYVVGLKSDGTVIAVGNNVYGQCNVSDWNDIIAIDTGVNYSVGLKSDGTVVATGNNEFGQCEVSDWNNIVAISAGSRHIIGLKSDGTVVGTGDNRDGQLNISNWKDIVNVETGNFQTAGLKSNGTVVATGYNDFGQCEVSDWKNIIAAKVRNRYTMGLKSNGTVVTVGEGSLGERNVSDWDNIIAIDSTGSDTFGLKINGTAVAVGYNNKGQCNVSGWKDIIAIKTGSHCTIGLKSDGTVVATGDNDNGQCDVSDWEDIIAIYTDYDRTIGLKSDGTVVSTGDDNNGLYDISDWTDIKTTID